MHDAVPVSDLLRTVFESILEVFVLCLAGLALARAGITDKATQRKLNRLNISLFTPCLLFSKVAFSLNPQKIKEMWIVPVGFVVVTGTSMAVAWLLGGLLRLKKSQKAFAMAASGFMNSNSLPIALMQSLVVEVPGLKWDADDTKEAMLGRALTYLVLYSTLGMMLRWSFGVRLLTMADDEPSTLPPPPPPPMMSPGAIERGDGREASVGTSTTVVDGAEGGGAGSAVGSDDDDDDDEVERPRAKFPLPPSMTSSDDDRDPWRDALPPPPLTARPPPPRRPSRRPSDFHSFPNSPKSMRVGLPVVDGDDDDEDEGGDEDGGGREGGRGGQKKKSEGWRRTVRRWGRTVGEFMTVPMWSALISIAIAMVPPVQAELAKLRPIRSAIKSSGACSIPVTLIVLGAYFYGPDKPSAHEPPRVLSRPPPPKRSWLHRLAGRRHHPRGEGHVRLEGEEDEPLGRLAPNKPTTTPGEKRTIFVAVFARMVLTPLLLIPVVALLAIYDPFEVAEDPIFICTAVLVISSPPAITLAQITQASSGDAFESLISKTIWISYGVLTPPLTMGYIVLALYLSRY